MANPRFVPAGDDGTQITQVPPSAVEGGDGADPALADSRHYLRLFFALLVVLCVALVAGDSRERGMALYRGVFLVGAVVFGSVALMPARKLEDVFLRPAGSRRLNPPPADGMAGEEPVYDD